MTHRVTAEVDLSAIRSNVSEIRSLEDCGQKSWQLLRPMLTVMGLYRAIFRYAGLQVIFSLNKVLVYFALLYMAVFTLVFSRLGSMPSGGVPYPLFAYAALVPWFFFSNSVNSGTLSLITYRNIVTKTYFPREIVPLVN